MTSFGESTLKSTWATRRVPPDLDVAWLTPSGARPGDVLLCEVLRTGIHGRVETAVGARSKIYAGDHIAFVAGARYATSMLEAVADVSGPTIDMISASGLCGRVVSRSRDTNSPTRLRPLAQAFHQGQPVNVADFALAPPLASVSAPEPRWVVVVGSSMDSGKTTACVSAIRGLRQAGLEVGAAKITGTASARDFGSFRDAGATPVVDFLDAGWASTVDLSAAQLAELLRNLTGHLTRTGVACGVLEIADGLLQRETRELLPIVAEQLPGCDVVLTVGDGLGAVAGAEILRSAGLSLTTVSGLVTNSPLACREAEAVLGLPTTPTSQLGRFLAELAPAGASAGAGALAAVGERGA